MASDQNSRKKRPLPNDRTDGIGDQSPKRKSRRGLEEFLSPNARGSQAARSGILSPFLPCHLTMLRSLCSGDKIDRKRDSTPKKGFSVEDEMWSTVQHFLQKRGVLLRCKERSYRLQGIHEEANALLPSNWGDKGVGSSATSSQNVRNTEIISLGIRLRHIQPSWTQQQDPNLSGLSFSTQAMSEGHAQMKGLLSPQPVLSMPASTPDIFHLQPVQERGCSDITSWALMARLLGKKSAAATYKARRMAEEFLPLITAVDIRVEELRGILNELVGTNIQKSELELMPANSNATPDEIDFASKEVEEIVETETKMRLWHLLSMSLKESVEI